MMPMDGQVSGTFETSRETSRLVPFPVDWEQIPSGLVDLSFLNGKPAGEEGFLEICDGHFHTPDGERIRIWGVNFTAGACYPEKADAPRVAQFLSSMGINGVRFHFLDSNWGPEKSIFPFDTATTRIFHPDQLDKLDYFVAELKKQGIYSNFNLNVGRNYREQDGVPFHEYLGLAKAITLFNDHLISLQKEYARMLLTHRNPYTGREYRNEPALAFLEIVNENSLLEAWTRGRLRGKHNSTRTSTWIDIPPYYAAELTLKYNAWLERELPDEAIIRLRKETGVGETELIPRLDPDEFDEASGFRFHTEARFIMGVENSFYNGMYRFLKDSIRVKQLVAANSDHSHYKSSYALLSSLSRLDFVDGHVYWQLPGHSRDPETGERSFHIENTPMVNDPRWSTPVQLARSAVKNKPYTVSETNHPYPNEYACEGIPILGAYALLQDWDGIYFYTFEHDDPSSWNGKVTGHFDLIHDPVKVANLTSGALMFRRGDLDAANTTAYRDYSESEIREALRKDPAPRPFFTPGFPQLLPLVYRTRIRSLKGGNNRFPTVDETSPLVSETGQISWYYRENTGLVAIHADRTQALIGFTERMDSIKTRNLTAFISNPFASIMLTSIDGKPLEMSDKMMLTTTSLSVLSGAHWNNERTSLKEWGYPPFQILPVSGEVTLMHMKGGSDLKITPLDGAWNPAGESMFASADNGIYRFRIGDIPTVWYLIEKVKNNR
jgi:hypothetical protein